MNEPRLKAGAFAAAIVRRYGDGSLFAPMLDMTVRLTPQAPPARISSFHTRVEIAPRIAVTVMNQPAPPSVRDARPPHTSAVHADVVGRLVNRQRRSEIDVKQTAADLHPARVLAVGRSQDTFGGQASESPRHIGASPVPLPMTLCRPAKSVPVEDQRERRQGGSNSQVLDGQTRTRTRAAETATAAVPAPINVDQLTDKVMRALDRRIVAYRERTAGG
jgi:hypothetical protein